MHHVQVYWPTLRWCDNPWFQDQNGRMLSRARYPRMHLNRLEELNFQVLVNGNIQCKLPVAPEEWRATERQRISFIFSYDSASSVVQRKTERATTVVHQPQC